MVEHSETGADDSGPEQGSGHAEPGASGEHAHTDELGSWTEGDLARALGADPPDGGVHGLHEAADGAGTTGTEGAADGDEWDDGDDGDDGAGELPEGAVLMPDGSVRIPLQRGPAPNKGRAATAFLGVGLTLNELYMGRQREEAAIVIEASGDTEPDPDDPFLLDFDPFDPRSSRVLLRPGVDRESDGRAGADTDGALHDEGDPSPDAS